MYLAGQRWDGKMGFPRHDDLRQKREIEKRNVFNYSSDYIPPTPTYEMIYTCTLGMDVMDRAAAAEYVRK